MFTFVFNLHNQRAKTLWAINQTLVSFRYDTITQMRAHSNLLSSV